MFKEINIKITEPICDCETQDLAWSILEGPKLCVKCKKCDTQIIVSTKKFVARIILDKKYPKYECDECGKLHDSGISHKESEIKDIVE